LCFISLVLILPGLARTETPQKAPALVQQEFPPISVQNVKGAIYQIKGGAGANTGFFIGEKGVLVIDAKMTEESAGRMLAEIRKLTPLPLTFVLITHSDQDHVNGLTGFPRGAGIISHENTRIHMDRAFLTPRERSYLPTITFSEKMSIYPDGPGSTRIDLFSFGPAHTDGDAVVLFPRERVAFIGDLIFIGRDQLIHRHKNGNSSGLVKTLYAVAGLDADVFVSGHSDPVTAVDIRNYARGIEEKQIRVRALVGEGKTLPEVKKALAAGVSPSQEGASRWPSLVEVIYGEEAAKK
jgi:cyclase